MEATKRLKDLNDDEVDGGSSSSELKTVQEILPPEMWLLVFTKVEGPEDLRNIFNTSPVWAKLLRTKNFYFKMTLPFLFRYLSGADMLACSAVSKSWNAAADACLQYNEDTNTGISKRYVLDATLSSTNMPGFIEKYTGATGLMPVAMTSVPFQNINISVRLQAQIGEEAIPDQLSVDRENLRKCLAHHGHCIRNCKLSLDFTMRPNVSGLHTLKLIRTCLKRMPNLRHLYIVTSETVASSPDEEREAIRNYISQNPLPPLPHLKGIEFHQFPSREELSSVTRAYAPQLKHMRFGCLKNQPQVPARVSGLQQTDDATEALESGMPFTAFIQSSRSPLNTLCIKFPLLQSDTDLNRLTVAVNTASDSLENLQFHPDMESFDSSGQFEGPDMDIRKMERLRLPKLKMLEIVCFTFPSLDFLHSVCPALEQLVVAPSFAGNMLKSGRIYRNLYRQHRFWKRLPLLQRVIVDLMLGPRYVVEEKQNGRSIRKKIDGGKKEIEYTREEYEAKLAEARATKRNGARSTSQKRDQSGSEK